jgi:hypothetical protein
VVAEPGVVVEDITMVVGGAAVVVGGAEVAVGVDDTGEGVTCSVTGPDVLLRYTPSGDPKNWAVMVYGPAWLNVVTINAFPCTMIIV